jgi:hypothetical protein
MTTLVNWIWNDEKTSAHATHGRASAKIWLGAPDDEGRARWFYLATAPKYGKVENDTYSADSARDYAWRFMRAVEFQTLIAAVAKELGPSWDVKKHADPQDRLSTHYNQLVDYGGRARLWFSLEDSKISIGAGHNDQDAENKHARTGECVQSINVSASKTPTQIVADMRRRLFPGLATLVKVIDERSATAAKHVDLTAANAARVAKSIGAAVQGLRKYTSDDGRKREIDLYRSSALPEMLGDITVCGDGVTFERFEVSPDEAIAMLSTLVKLRKGSK